MTMRPILFIPSALALLAVAAAPDVAHAGIEACGDISIQADAHCEVVAEGCELHCTPPAVEAACAAELYANCEGECEASASASCEASCSADCYAQCEIDPGAFSCQAACEADCSGSCEARCDSNDSECWAACEATCSAECGASCEVTPPQADCAAQCEASCSGSCEAEASLDCQIDCQADYYAECKVDLQGGCEAECSDAGAALFCDGQWVDHGNNLQECIAALEQGLQGEVEGSAQFECVPGECTFDAAGLFGCNVDGGTSGRGGALFAALFGLGFAFTRRRRHS